MSQYKKVITLLDSSFAVVGDPVKVWESLLFTDGWEKHGSIALTVEKAEYPNIKQSAWLQIDGRVYENETTISDADSQTVRITGASLNVLFDRIVITAKERLQGRLEERVRYLVNKYAIEGSQRVTGLVLGTDNGFKRAMDITVTRGQTLSEVLYTALPQRGYSFEIVCDCDGTGLTFNVLEAKDRTQNQSVNPPVTMSTLAEIEKASYKKTIMDYRNFAVVCDEDETAPQTVEVDLSNGEPVRAMYVSGSRAGADESEAPNQFVMVGTYSAGVGYVATSTDGSSFTNRITSGYAPFWAADFQNGKFIVCGDPNNVLRSEDATTWASSNPHASAALEGALYYDGLYLITGNSALILRSYDLLTFDALDASGGKLVSPLFANGYLTAVGSGGSTFACYRSPNGFDYYEFNTFSLGDASVTSSSISRSIYTVGNLIAFGSITISGTNYPLLMKSFDSGKTWNQNNLTSFSGKHFLDAAFGNGIIVAVGQPNIIAWSDDDGETWTDCTPSGTGTPDWIAVCFDGTQFHAYSSTTKHHAYGDGKTWTRTTFTTSAIFIDAVVYGTSSHTGNLYQIGVDALNEANIVETIDGDVNTDLAPIYKIDYNVGDVIDVIDPDHELVASKTVLEVEHLIDKTTDYSITPKLGKDALTLRQLISKEIKNNGI